MRRAIIAERGYRRLEPASDEYGEFEYQPKKCERSYRIVVLRRTINVSEGNAQWA